MPRRALLPACLIALVAVSVQAQESLPKLKTEVAFPNVQFKRPLVLAAPKDGRNLLFVVEQHTAEIHSFTNTATSGDKQLFLKLPDKINTDNEEGLLGLAFHPKYKENREFFVYYSAKDEGQKRRSVVSRFRASKDDPRKADESTEERVWISADDPFANHNGGCIEFGPDGMLYISLGDSGAADDPLTTGQNPKDWFGSILRIDVNTTENRLTYGIPKDNPAKRDPIKFKDWAPEVYCIGLRNVWRFSFDRQTGDLWAGDVGQNKWEIVHLIKNGGNYGWSVNEGFHPFRKQKIDPASRISKPIAEYPHDAKLDPKRTDLGKSITGGYVYRGKALPELVGVYVYADFESGRIWGLREKAGEATISGELIDITKGKPLQVASFGEDADGELYILAFDSKIHRLVPR